MDYEARYARGIHFGLAAACILLSILGFAVAGVIPTESGSYPLVGWAIVVACFAAAFVFVRRARDAAPQARVDGAGVWSCKLGKTVPWSDISGVHFIAAGIQRIARFERRDAGTFGINTTFYDRGIADLLAAVRHHRPDFGA